MGVYRRLIRPALFRTDPERIHDRSIRLAELVSSSPLACRVVAGRYTTPDERLAVEVAGLRFGSPVGLAAGFDKSARAVPALTALGFGHIEVGSISAERSGGNPRPRLFRVPADHGIVVHYGVPNDGADRVADRLSRARLSVPLGVNVVNTNRGPAAPADREGVVIDDYVASVRRLQGRADYLCLNLSCPNTREGFFADARRLRLLLDSMAGLGITRPVFLKVAPFPSIGDLEAFLAAVAPAEFVAGFSVNLPSGKPTGMRTPPDELARMPGAVSGRPSEPAANHTIRELYRRMDRDRYAIIGSGGVFTAEDAYRKIRLGASLVQLLTSLVYCGPGVVRSINRELPLLLARDGFRRVADAVGVDS